MSNEGLVAPDTGDTWIGLSEFPLPVEAASSWVVLPRTGAAVTFNGTARDHARGSDGEYRPNVDRLHYEAYEGQALPRMEGLVVAARQRWPELVRVALLHRTGEVALGDSAVVVAVSSAHRGAAFEACAWLIDTLKSTVPIWKREEWEGGSSWGLEPQHLTELPDVGGS